jgi:hypothetical protein
MALPTEPVTLSAEQISELNQKLTVLRHDANNHLSLIMAAAELIRRRPESTDQMLKTLVEQPQKIAAAVERFSSEIETALQIKRP